VKAIFILRHVIAIGEGSSRLGVLLGGSPLSLFDMLLTRGRGFENLMFTLWFTLLGGLFVFLDACFSILFLVFPFFGLQNYIIHLELIICS